MVATTTVKRLHKIELLGFARNLLMTITINEMRSVLQKIGWCKIALIGGGVISGGLLLTGIVCSTTSVMVNNRADCLNIYYTGLFSVFACCFMSLYYIFEYISNYCEENKTLTASVNPIHSVV